MTVEELIEALKEFFPGAIVTIHEEYEDGWQELQREKVYEDNEGIVRIG